jgi:TP901 family phage tail tape measure protein
MAKTISDEEMKLTMIINGNSAQKELFDLEKSTRKLNEENKALLLQKKLLEKQGKKDTDQYKLLTATIKDNNAEILVNKTRMSELQKEIGLTGLTMGQLQSKAIMLRNILRNLIPGSEDYVRYDTELRQVTARMDEVSGRAQASRTSISSLADGFNRYQALVVSFIAGLTGVVLSIQKIIDINGKLSDAQSDVMKTTGMTKIEVDELTKSFGLLQSRTSRIDLLGIAEQGGRIGIAKAEISDFVSVMNKASVALGDSFSGGAEEVANKLGKIKFLFEQTKDMNVDQAYNSIGSAINDLGANGTASEANIADFTTRIGSLTDVLKPTIQETLALGTAFEESGIESEVSARAYGIFMKQASTETAKFAQVMGTTEANVKAMINTNPLEFMLKFSQGMKGMSATDTAKTLDALGISADGANKVIGAMGNNTARFRELIDLSNNSFSTGASLVNEYDLKNNNLAATLEKISKTVSGWFSSETFIKWLTVAVSWFATFIGAAENADGTVSAWKNTLVFTAKVLAIVTAAIITNVGWQKLVALWTTRSTEANILYAIAARARAFADGVAMIASQAYAAATMLMTGNIRGAIQAFRAMTAAMMTTPWGFIISAIAAIGVAYIAFSDSASDAAEIQKTLANVHLEATKSIAKEKSELELLTKIAQDENISKEKRLKAIERLNEIIPDYIGHLSMENIKTAEGIGILKKYTEELYANARAKAVQSKFDELAKEKVNIEGKTTKDYQSGVGKFMSKITGQGEGPQFSNRKDIERYVLKNFAGYLNSRKDKTTGVNLVDKKKFETLVNNYMNDYGIADKEKELALKDAQMKSLEGELLKNTVNDLGKPDGKTPPSGYKPPTDAKDKKGKTTKKYDDSYINDELKHSEDLYNIRKKAEEARISLMQDGYDKDLALEKLNTGAKIQELKFQNQAIKNLDEKLDKDLIAAQKAGDSEKITSIENQKRLLLEKQQGNNDLICYEEEMQKLRIGTIQEKGAKETLQKRKEAFDQAKVLRETKFNEELAKLGSNEQAKEKLRKKFALSELGEEEKFLKEVVEQFNLIVGKGNLGKMDMSLLTPEQVESFTAEAAKVGLTLAELIAKKNELTGKGAVADAAALGVSGGNTDIFGFTPDNWVQLSGNLANGTFGINEMVFAVSALTDAWGKYNEFVTANENANLQKFVKTSDEKKKKLRKQLDSGMISQSQYNKRVEKIDEDLDNKKADLEYKQAKRQRMISAANIIMSTAQAIIGIWAQFPKADFGITAGIMSGVVGALGALQLATVLATPLPAKGHEEGLYPEYVKRQQDGKTFKSKYQGKTRSGLVSETSHFLVAENGPEMVIDNKAWRQMDPEVKEALVRNLQGIKGFENGMYNTEKMRYEVPAASNNPASSGATYGDTELLQMVLAVISENTAVMKDLRDRGVIGKFFKNDLQSAKNIQESISDYNDLRNKSKK